MLTRDLKGRMNFSGWVMSDWGATHKTSALMAGLDQEMPGAAYMSAAKVAAQLQAGTITQAQIDAAVLRMLVPMFAVVIRTIIAGIWVAFLQECQR
eukprot:COSAG04_NODE_8186_length_1010_cov_0.776070_2_plen_96_part_00